MIIILIHFNYSVYQIMNTYDLLFLLKNHYLIVNSTDIYLP